MFSDQGVVSQLKIFNHPSNVLPNDSQQSSRTYLLQPNSLAQGFDQSHTDTIMAPILHLIRSLDGLR